MAEKSKNEKTKPMLTPTQLAAARILVRGASSRVASTALGASRRTIDRWKRQPEFRDEILRLHDLLAVAPPDAPTQTRRNFRKLSTRGASDVHSIIDQYFPAMR